ncbi:MAG TPA: hypothetical protein VGQ97_06310, partial [Xanthobacteraceae bacterium]|nr:hypothetical protein [Xanthobacteraceae bacterium]
RSWASRVTGRLQNEYGVIHVVADRIDDLTPLLRQLAAPADPVGPLVSTAAVMPKGRNFH